MPPAPSRSPPSGSAILAQAPKHVLPIQSDAGDQEGGGSPLAGAETTRFRPASLAWYMARSAAIWSSSRLAPDSGYVAAPIEHVMGPHSTGPLGPATLTARLATRRRIRSAASAVSAAEVCGSRMANSSP